MMWLLTGEKEPQVPAGESCSLQSSTGGSALSHGKLTAALQPESCVNRFI